MDAVEVEKVTEEMVRRQKWSESDTTNAINVIDAAKLHENVVGFAVALLFILTLLTRTWRMAVQSPGPQAAWSLQVILVLILGDFVETRAFVNIGWFLLCVIAYYSATPGQPPSIHAASSQEFAAHRPRRR